MKNSDTSKCAANNVTTAYYYSLSLPYQQKYSGSDINSPLVTHTYYDGNGRVIEVDDEANGSVTWTHYDPVTGQATTSSDTIDGDLTFDDSLTTTGTYSGKEAVITASTHNGDGTTTSIRATST